jgi:hypothetical protein
MAGGIDMRLGGWRGGKIRIPRHKAVAYGLITIGAVIMLVSVPFYVYAAVFGALIAYAGYVLRGR